MTYHRFVWLTQCLGCFLHDTVGQNRHEADYQLPFPDTLRKIGVFNQKHHQIEERSVKNRQERKREEVTEEPEEERENKKQYNYTTRTDNVTLVAHHNRKTNILNYNK